jgi:hypothetical protein
MPGRLGETAIGLADNEAEVQLITHGNGNETQGYVAYNYVDCVQKAKGQEDGCFAGIQLRKREVPSSDEDECTNGTAKSVEGRECVWKRKLYKDRFIVECESEVQGEIEDEVE